MVASLTEGFLKREKVSFHGMDGKTTSCKESIMGKDFLGVGAVNLDDAMVPVCF
jgi:hypothetical protein